MLYKIMFLGLALALVATLSSAATLTINGVRCPDANLSFKSITTSGMKSNIGKL